MTRTSYVWCPEAGELVPKGTEAGSERYHMLMMDIEPFVSPVDGTHIHSRSDLRRHMKKNDLVPADDYKESWKKAAKDRELRQAGIHPDQKRERIQNLRDSYERVRDQSRYSRY